jgi:Ca-activated chloride channel family protein
MGCAGGRKEQKPSQDDALSEVRTSQEIAPAERQDERLLKLESRVANQAQYAPGAPAMSKAQCCLPFAPEVDRENYAHVPEGGVQLAADQPVSTFSIDVDTGSYANMRRFLNAGQLPPQDAVRVEEFINYFDYSYPVPATREVPFQVTTELAHAPWNVNALLLRIGLKGYAVHASERPAANLVFLIDVSGSMQTPDKLPLLKNAFRLLTEQLAARDRVAIVVYAGAAGTVLESTPGNRKSKILEAIDNLEAGGSTNGGAGITLAYRVARDHFMKDGINRVILATDGDFNVGAVNFESLLDIAKRERESGVALSTMGFGTGNYNDRLMEQLADAGNGNYAYVDTLNEARKVLVEEVSSTLFTIAKDVKVQVEFNPATVREYRLIGYENRLLAREDFNNDRVDAGDVGAGHRVTALYEIIPVENKGRIDALRYGEKRLLEAASTELAFVRLRYKRPDEDKSRLLEVPVLKSAVIAAGKETSDFCFAAAVAAFGQKLRGGKFIDRYNYDDIRTLAARGYGADVEGYRHEFGSLVRLAQSLAAKAPVARNDESAAP